ncbi:hypothetical protein [Chitinophaga sp. LS1]|uniref:HU domain-containing protein n=1 Tax=Chitinophaga sp. LS1 TaxID=3051176 RepID=UPI002AAAC6B3|nr:hypothetical protein [Chitinophaga sp. LS1]WPV70120.1 hypothetical protein QQL36_15555 [Chitinophaga sp. LS1]
MVLQQYIQDTLFRKEPCILPKTGIFSVQHIPARYNVTTKTLEPPQEVILFEDTWGDEEQLVKWISQREHLVDNIARMKMEKYVEEVQTMLKSGQTFAIPGVGQLKADMAGQVIFIAEYLPIELETLMVQPVIRTDVSHRVTIGDKEFVNNQVVNHVSASSENAKPNPGYTTNSDYPPYPEPAQSSFRWWWVAVPVAVVLAAGLVWWLIAKQPLESQEPVISADRSTPATVDTTLVQDSTTRTDSSQQQAASSATATNKTYYVVVEEFHDLKKATKKLNFHHKNDRGYVTLQADSNDTSFYRLLVPFNTPLADTTKSKDSIQKFFGVPKRPIVY